MIISDLNYIRNLSEETGNLAGGSASVGTGAWSSAMGSFTFTAANTNTWAASSPYAGSVALGYAQSVGLAYTPPSFKFP
ncbi:MAG TPA: hypothetical protein DCE56_02925 [Cyanobacteria bacterium UBA8553]|nr:hypothetical protein [Cyanobacteria bacterium UBA8553]HAJ63558.1 hypothetical protein [Cyanobacteria bacterium UBA8543]